MIDNDIQLVMILDSLIESSAPVSFTGEQMILSMNLKSSPCVHQYQSFTQEQMIPLMNLKSSPIVYHYQSFTLVQMILSINLKSSPGVYHY